MKDLTPGECREMLYMVKAPQPTFGKGRVAIQNRLVEKGLARFTDDAYIRHCVLTVVGDEMIERFRVKMIEKAKER